MTRLGALGLRSAWSCVTSALGGRWGPGEHQGHCPSNCPHTGFWPVLARVQEQLTSLWEGNQALAARTQDQLAQHEAGLMDLREALNRAVGTTREAEELNSRNQERLEEALVRSPTPPVPSPSLPLSHLSLPLLLSHLSPSLSYSSPATLHSIFTLSDLFVSLTPSSIPITSSNGNRSCPRTVPP